MEHYSTRAGVREAHVLHDAPTPAVPPYFPVATHKFIALSLCTLGLYQLFWFYQNWQRVHRRTGEVLSPFWRALFASLWGFAFFRRVATHASLEDGRPTWSASLLGALFLGLTVASRLPDPWWLLCLLSFVPLLPVLRTTQRLNARQAPTAPENGDYSIANILTLIFGGMVLCLAILGALLPAEGGV